MPAADYTIRQGDHGEQINDTLEDSTGAAVNIAGATIKITVAAVDGSAIILNQATANNDQNGDGSDGSKGKVHYTWQAADTATAGLYLASWTVIYSGGEVQTFPNGGFLLVEITAEQALNTGSLYVTVDWLKTSLELKTSNYDKDLLLAAQAASRAIDQMGGPGRTFYPGPTNVTRNFWPENSGYCVIDDLCEFTSINVLQDTWTLGQDFYLEPINAAVDDVPFTAIRAFARPFIFTKAQVEPGGWTGFDGRIQVTGQWGWATTPEPIREAAGILASRLFKRAREAPFGIVGLGVDVQAIRLGSSDPDVLSLVQPYSRDVLIA